VGTEESGVLESGFNWKTILAVLFETAVIIPISLYLYLLSGAYFAFGAIFVTAILFSEISRIVGVPLRKQELFLIYAVAGEITIITSAAGTPVLVFIWRRYFMESFISWAFIDPLTGQPLPKAVPSWWAPPIGSEAYHARSLFLNDWILPISIALVFSLFLFIQEIGLSSFCGILYLEREPLPFPWARVDAQMCITLAERPAERYKVFMVSTVAGIIYSIILYGIPTVTGMIGAPLMIIPIPWVDLTTGVLGVEKIMPGALFGIATDPISYVTGFILPLGVVSWMLVGSLGVWTFGNWLALTTWSSYFPDWANEWTRGMALAIAYQRSTLRVWIGPQFGFTLAAAAYVSAKSGRGIVRMFRTMAQRGGKGEGTLRMGYLSLTKSLLLYLIGGVGSIAIVYCLIPDFPMTIVIAISLGVSLVLGIFLTRALAETGVQPSIPYLWQGVVLMSGYEGLAPWFAPAPVAGLVATPRWANRMAGCIYTETRPLDFFKALIIGSVMVIIFSFVYLSIFWLIGPIPSSLYPATLIYWPLEVLSTGFWASRQITAFNPAVIAWPFGITLAIAIIFDVLGRFTAIPFSLMGLLTGFLQIPPFSVATFMGALLGNFGLKRFFKEKWDVYRSLLAAGIVTGVGITAGVSSAIVMITKAGWILPY